MFGFNKKPQKELTKSFAGKMENFKDNRERHFYQRMLRAYLKGKEYFNFGFHDVKMKDGTIRRLPKPHKVLIKWV